MGLIKTKKRAFSSATNEVRRSRKRVLIASAMRKQSLNYLRIGLDFQALEEFPQTILDYHATLTTHL